MLRAILILATIATYVNGILHAATGQDAKAITYFGAGAFLTLIATIYYAYQDAKQ